MKVAIDAMSKALHLLEYMGATGQAADKAVCDALDQDYGYEEDGSFGGYSIMGRSKRYTTSLDAAISLLPSDCSLVGLVQAVKLINPTIPGDNWMARIKWHTGTMTQPVFNGDSRTPAAALTIAALKVIQAKLKPPDTAHP